MPPRSLSLISEYADGIGPCKNLLTPRTKDDRLGTPTTVVADAHEAGLFVHPYTFRAENRSLPVEFCSGGGPNAVGDLSGEISAFLDLEVDGFITDHPALTVNAVTDHSS